MKEFIGKSGSNIYLVSKDTDEACRFNSYGEKQEDISISMAIISSKYFEPVDILSIVGEPSISICEVYFNGNVAVVNANYFEVYSKLREITLMDSVVPLRIVHENNAMQVLLPYKKNCINIKFINNRIPNLKWEKLF